MLHFKLLEKQEQATPKTSRKREIKKIGLMDGIGEHHPK
jgi:hypothetical protein